MVHGRRTDPEGLVTMDLREGVLVNISARPMNPMNAWGSLLANDSQ